MGGMGAWAEGRDRGWLGRTMLLYGAPPTQELVDGNCHREALSVEFRYLELLLAIMMKWHLLLLGYLCVPPVVLAAKLSDTGAELFIDSEKTETEESMRQALLSARQHKRSVRRATITGLDGRMLHAIVGLPNPRELSITVRGIEVLPANLASMTQLKLLVLDAPECDNESIGNIFRSISKLRNLQGLSSRLPSASPLTATALQNCRRLRSLSLVDTHVEPDPIRSLHRTSVKSVWISPKCMTPELAKELVTFPKQTKIAVPRAGVRQYLEILKDCATMETIGLAGSDVSDEDLKLLRNLRSLRELFLGSTTITKEGLQNIGHLPNLRDLSLNNSPGIDDDCLATIRTNFPGLKKIRLGDTRISKAAVTLLQSQMKNLELN